MKKYNTLPQQFVDHVMKNLTEKIFGKFKDHCYYTGKYQGTPHSVCNLKFKEHRYIPLIAHISSGFDNQLILPNITEKFKECIDENTKKLAYLFFAQRKF